ncbi:MAG: TIGR04255 family protein [Phycisphaeraceae bacterium]|nr:MAG: TIGR04255 family protein [Phycisphaeraceae bacterium]
MTIWPTLSKAPIVEGLIDIRVERLAEQTTTALKSACDELAGEFPLRIELRHWAGQINLSPQASPSISTAVDEPGGYLLRSTDEKWVAQFRLDGFTVSRLQPYGTWDDLKGMASKLWTKYSVAANPTRVVRVASRFINRVKLPTDESFEKTFLTNFVLGPTLPQSVAGSLLRVIIPFEDQNAVAIVTQSLEGISTECIFDLDAFSHHPEGIAEEEMWSKLDKLREVKNRLFFGSFTEAALERFR